MSQSGLLELAHEKLYWPSPSQILQPTGAGPSVYARLAEEKIGKTIQRDCQDGAGLRVGVLAANPDGDATEAPIAIVCDFPKTVSNATLKKTYQLAWSFSRAQALITIEPHLLRVWTCCEKPPTESENLNPVVPPVSRTDLDLLNQPSLSKPTESSALRWVDLVSGQFFQDRSDRFQRSGAADQMLLNNLKEVRRQLKELKLEQNTIHDLLARIIFIQFLSDRKDSAGNPALNETVFKDLHRRKILSNYYRNFSEILRDHDDTYKLFRWLNDKFNGDLFPGKGATEAEREADWQAEMQRVEQPHLSLLAEFVSGDLEMKDGQLCLWRQYSFDAIPLDFISSIYEEFVSKKSGTGIHYTPEHIVDFILDGVLSWNSQDWDLKILDPACGSGIFLVKAFQRLIYRWQKAHRNRKIKPSDLRSLLENNLFGVDVDTQAVRVASFSLYLTMLDKIDPLEYWENEVRFPILRERQLITADFFQEDKEGFRTDTDAAKYDLVIGNAPWGKNSVKKSLLVEAWESKPEHKGKWKSSYGNIGLLFLPKAAALTKAGGQVAMMQPAMPMLFNQSGPAREFREIFFLEFKIEEIVNLSTLRFGLFKDAISPTCIITMCVVPPDGEPFSYICPKPVFTNEDDYRLVIEPQDINIIYPQEAISVPIVWTALMWGGRRDFTFMRQLSQQQSLAKLENDKIAVSSQGIKRGIKENEKKRYEPLRNRRILDLDNFPGDTFLYLRTDALSINDDPYAERPRAKKPEAFNSPQLIIKQSWITEYRRFKAAIATLDKQTSKGIICKESYVSVHVNDKYFSVLEAACLSYNSKLAVYYLFLSIGRFASYIPEVKPKDLLHVPIPESYSGLLQNIETIDDVDQIIRQAFAFKDSEWVLIEDLFNYTLPDFKGDSSSPGRQKTCRRVSNLLADIVEPELKAYCEYFLRVIKAGLGQDKNVCATIFQEQTATSLPVRLVAIYLNRPDCEAVQVQPMNSPDLLKRLERLNELFLDMGDSSAGGIFYQRVARVYDSVQLNDITVPTIYLIKPDKIRYWTRSMALRDADEVAADIMLWRTGFDRESEVMQESYRG